MSLIRRKPATRVFQHFSFRRHGHAEPIRRSVVTRPKVKKAELEKCDSRKFAIIRGGISHVSAHNSALFELNPCPTRPYSPTLFFTIPFALSSSISTILTSFLSGRYKHTPGSVPNIFFAHRKYTASCPSYNSISFFAGDPVL